MKRLLFFTALLPFLLAACDPCAEVNCLNGGDCVDGTCECPTGFSGSSCEIEDECITNSVTCLNGGTCVDGECECEEWYEGQDCGDRVIEKYENLYSGTYTCAQGSSTANFGTAELHDTNDEDEMELEEYTGRVYSIEFDNETDFDIPNQTVVDNSGYSTNVSGSGDVDGDDLTFSVSYSTQGSSTVNCVFSGSN